MKNKLIHIMLMMPQAWTLSAAGVSNYAPSVYFIHVYVNGNEEEVHRFTIIK